MTWRSLLVAKPVAALLILLTVTMVVTATTIFTQTFPAVTTAAMSQTCAGGNLVLVESEPLPAGVAGQATFQCSGPNPAFQTTGSVTATPTFTLPSPYTDLYIYKWNGATTTSDCSLRSFAEKILNNVQEVSLPALSSPSGWNYCAEYGADNIAGLTSFTVTWDSP